MSEIELNIQPKAGILKIFSRLNYKPEFAIAEFVDNSTASYLGHRKELNALGIRKVTVRVEYEKNDNVLTIIDDAYGMDLNDFKRAVMMDQEPDHLNGRNEFGMGLKTAASWFGNVWSVTSTRLGNDEEYHAEINISELNKTDSNSIIIHSKKCNKLSHGTTIKIWDITKKISPKSKTRVKELLSSIYRRDINSDEIEILYDGMKLESEKFEVLKFKDRTWKEDLDFNFKFDNKTYHVTGFVGILAMGSKEKGSFPKAGFALFRHDRMVVGGPNQNYKPKEIFGQAQSQISLRLFGELNMEDFEVNQAKDGFIWDDGLEEEFVTNLKRQIQDFIEIAKKSANQRISEEQIDDDKSNLVESKVQDKFTDITLDEPSSNSKDENANNESKNESAKVKKFENELNADNKNGNETTSKVREYTIHFNDQLIKKFKVKWIIKNDDFFWFQYDEKNNEITINSNHPFFKQFITDDHFKVLIECFVLAFACAQEKAQLLSNTKNGYGEKLISPSTFTDNINKILKMLSEKGND